MRQEKITALVIKAQEGDNKALNKLFNEFYNEVHYFILKTVKNEDVAYDVTQEVFVEVIRTLSSLKEPEAFKSWLYKVAYHQCTRYFRKKKDILVEEDEDGNTIFDDLEDKSAEFVPDKALEQKEFKETVISMINDLSEEQRSAVMLYYFDELSIKEIAKIQGVSEGTIKSRLNYGRKAIKKSVEQYEKENGIKLHSIPFFPFVKWLFSEEASKTMAIGSAKALAESVAVATGTSLNVATGIGAQIIGLPLSVKIVSGIVAIALVTGTATGVWYANRDTVPVSNNNTTTTTTTELIIEENTTVESTTLAVEETTQKNETTTQSSKETTTTKKETTTKTETTTQEASILSDEVAFAAVEEFAESHIYPSGYSGKLPYFKSVSELSIYDVGMYIFKNIKSNYEETYYDESSEEYLEQNLAYYITIPVSDFNLWAKRYFGRTYNFKELDGCSCYFYGAYYMQADGSYADNWGNTVEGVAVEDFIYDAKTDSFTITTPGSLPGDATVAEAECTNVEKVGPNTYTTTAVCDDKIEKMTFSYVNGYWRPESCILVK